MLSGFPAFYSDGDVIFAQGDASADMYIIRSGGVRIMREGSSGDVEIARLGENDFFGEMGLFSPAPRSATAIAVGETEVDVVDKTTFLSVVQDPVVWQMLEKMSERIRQADEVFDS